MQTQLEKAKQALADIRSLELSTDPDNLIKKKAKEIVEMEKIKHKKAKPDKYLVGVASGEFTECDEEDLKWVIEEMIYDGFREDEIVVYSAYEVNFEVEKTVKVKIK